MELSRYAVLENGTVVHIIEWVGNNPYSEDSGLSLIQSDIAAIGDTYTDGEFIKPPEPTQAQE
jgi:hypothetical protein